MKTFEVELLLPTKRLGIFAAKQITLPGVNGYLGLLPDHTDFVSQLGTGKIVIEDENSKESEFFSSGGFVEVSHNKVKCCMNIAEAKATIDVERAKKAKERAENRLKDLKTDVNFERAQLALLKAVQRIEIAKS